MNKTTSVIVALAAGAAAGFIAGLLLAPEKGEDTRKKITDAGKKFTSKVTDKVSEVMGTYKKEFANGEES
ncbi:MAG TPA: YtxH domain-containing protein [Chitinophagaceae bacterium]